MAEQHVIHGGGNYFGMLSRTASVGGLTLAETHYRPHLSIAPHHHECPSFLLVLRGGFAETSNDGSHTIRAGSAVYHPAGERHSGAVLSRKTRAFNVEVTGSFASGGTAVRHSARTVRCDAGRMSWVLAALYRELQAPDDFASLAISGLGMQLIAECSRATRRASSPVIARAIALLHDGGKAVTVDALAQAACCSPSELLDAFHRELGMSPAAYMRRHRLAVACTMLARTDTTIGTIALETGFYDQAHFTRQFRATMGVTPGQYRAQCRSARHREVQGDAV